MDKITNRPKDKGSANEILISVWNGEREFRKELRKILELHSLIPLKNCETKGFRIYPKVKYGIHQNFVLESIILLIIH